MADDSTSRRPVALVLAGGIGLGAYQAGAYQRLHAQTALRATWIAGASVGAINAAVIAGSAPDQRVPNLRALWHCEDAAALRTTSPPPGWRGVEHVQNWGSALQTRVTGSAGFFRPRLSGSPWQRFRSLYDLAPLRARLDTLVDFDRLNSGATRVCIAATDLASGALVLFDTAHGVRIGMDHLMASCGFMPEFPAVEIDGRWLGDGGLAANAPIEALLQERPDGDLAAFVVDLYARDGTPPETLEEAVARKSDLIFANQTWQRLEAYRREEALRADLADGLARLSPKATSRAELRALAALSRPASTTILLLSYRPPAEEAGSERPYDYSRRSIARRWDAGCADMAAALDLLAAQTDGTRPRVSLMPVRRAG